MGLSDRYGKGEKMEKKMNKKLWLMILALSCFIAIVTCIIVNIVTNGKITWGIYPILSIPFGFLMIVPLFAKSHRIALTLSSITIFLLPYLFLLAKVTPIKGWFIPLGLPIAITGLITIWIFYLLLRYLRINAWYKVSIVIFLCGVIVNPIINYFIDKSGLAKGNGILISIINIFSFVVLAVVCGMYGHKKQQAAHKEENRT